MAEWLKAAVLKTVKGESSSRVRIPLSPPVKNNTLLGCYFFGRERVKRGALYVGIRKAFEVFWSLRPKYPKGILLV